MLAYTYAEQGRFKLLEKPKPVLRDDRDAIVRVTLASICTSGLHQALFAGDIRLAWQCARPNGIVTIVALYDEPQVLPLPDMYGKNLTFKTGGVDGCKCGEILSLIEKGKLDTTALITHTYPLREIDSAYELFESRRDGVIKVAVRCEETGR